jgi:glutamate/tyrosine decarboxylase-like PLP-dependent enzyme
LNGLGSADSLALDPHKWLFQPFEMGCVLVRDGQQLQDTFRILPEYLQDVHRGSGVNFCDYGIQLTRNFRALKLWLSLRLFGIRAFRDAIERGFELAEMAESRLKEQPRWEIVSPAHMAILCFRYVLPGMGLEDVNEFNRRLAQRVFRDGFATVTTTVLGGVTVLRMCTVNPRTTDEDIELTVKRLGELAREQFAETG